MVLEKWLKTLSKKSRVLILGHSGADVDAVSSAIALSESLPFACAIGYPDHANAQALALLSGLKISVVKNPSLSRFDAVILVDFHDAAHAGRLSADLSAFAGPIWVFDHHSKDVHALSTRFSCIDPSAVSCSLVVFEELQKAKLKISKKALQAIAAGILSDSASLVMADTRALSVLVQCLSQCKSEPDDITALFFVPEILSQRIAKLRSASRMRLFELNGILVAASEVGFFESVSADALIALGADVALVAGTDHHLGVLHFNARSTRQFARQSKISLSRLAKESVLIFGGNGNGHVCAAGFSCTHSQPRVVLDAALEWFATALRKKQGKLELREII
ncbi:MAG: DHH family phosphoesterase [Candidatus Diapherotrites archaeon]|nr:DHH family phosphoesterase [Candidatus Diapherotrites archaeon]